jgi:hypothetical protein
MVGMVLRHAGEGCARLEAAAQAIRQRRIWIVLDMCLRLLICSTPHPDPLRYRASTVRKCFVAILANY